jgi:tight adherence protein B
MIPIVATTLAALGAHYLYTSLALGWSGLGVGPPRARARRRSRLDDWLIQAGLADVRRLELVATIALLFVLGSVVAFVVFGGAAPALVAGGFAASLAPAAYRTNHRRRRALANDAWPILLEQLRVLVSSVGRSIPHALIEVGRRAPEPMQPAFGAAEREWLLSTDFARTVAVLKSELADPTADATCETLLVAHEVGGGDLDHRLAALIQDRIEDSHRRKDARAKQAGARFARRFVLIVPLGMACVGMSIGDGRHAYQSPLGQLGVTAGVAVVMACWVWAGCIMRVPEPERVLR